MIVDMERLTDSFMNAMLAFAVATLLVVCLLLIHMGLVNMGVPAWVEWAMLPVFALLWRYCYD